MLDANGHDDAERVARVRGVRHHRNPVHAEGLDGVVLHLAEPEAPDMGAVNVGVTRLAVGLGLREGMARAVEVRFRVRQAVMPVHGRSGPDDRVAGCGLTASSVRGGRQVEPWRRNSPGCGVVLAGSGTAATSGRSGRWPSSGSPRSGWALVSASDTIARSGTTKTPPVRSHTSFWLPIWSGSAHLSAR